MKLIKDFLNKISKYINLTALVLGLGTGVVIGVVIENLLVGLLIGLGISFLISPLYEKKNLEGNVTKVYIAAIIFGILFLIFVAVTFLGGL